MTTFAALDALRTRMAWLISMQAAFMRLMLSDVMSNGRWLSDVMNRYIHPRREDVEQASWSERAQARLAGLSQAFAAHDVMAALRNGRLTRPSMMSSREMSFFTFVDRGRELAGLREVLGWIEEFQGVVATGDVPQVMAQLAQLGLNPHGKCDCEASAIEDVDAYPTFAWTHAHHAEYNQAVWEVIASRSGLIEKLQEAIQADIDGPSTRVGRNGHVFGEIIHRPYARDLLRGFVQPTPTARWIGGGIAAAA